MVKAVSDEPQPDRNNSVIDRANTLYNAQAERALTFAEGTAVNKDMRDNAKKVSS